jgi:hypothetical protein
MRADTQIKHEWPHTIISENPLDKATNEISSGAFCPPSLIIFILSKVIRERADTQIKHKWPHTTLHFHLAPDLTPIFFSPVFNFRLAPN